MPRLYQILDTFGLTTTRIQIMIAFIFLIVLVLGIAGLGTYHSLTPLLQANMKQYTENFAHQLVGRMEVANNRVGSLSLQAVMDNRIQNLLDSLQRGYTPTNVEKLDIGLVLNEYLAFNPMIYSIELYTNDRNPLYPIGNNKLESYFTNDLLKQLELSQGRLIWGGTDPHDSSRIVAIRKIMQLSNTQQELGFELVKVDRSFYESAMMENNSGYPVFLFDRNGQRILSNRREMDSSLALLEQDMQIILNQTVYMTVIQKLPDAGWTMAILIPRKKINEPIAIMRDALFGAGIVGFIIVILVSILVSASITKSIYTVRKVMRQARNGKLVTNNKWYLNREANELNISYNKMVEDIEHLIKVVYEKELSQTLAELRALQAQIHPHFLYNTMEAMNWMLREKEEDEIADHLLDLSQLFRYSVMNSEWVTLREEFDHIERYVGLIMLRMKKKLQWDAHLSPLLSGCRIPRLLLQPLIENAVIHGIEPLVVQGSIRFSAVEKEDKLLIEVEDTGMGMKREALSRLELKLFGELNSQLQGDKLLSGTGIGLLNVDRRIRLLYGEEYRLRVESVEGNGTKVSICIPRVPNVSGDASIPLFTPHRLPYSGGES